jgi:hypothetical protein
MKYAVSSLALATAVAAHGYVNTALIGGQTYTFYQPYSDPYMNPKVQRVARPIQGNGPVQDVTLSDLQCGGYAEGGLPGSSPAALHANVTAGSDVKLYWTLWPDSHVGPTITYMAKCPDTGCNNWMPGSQYVSNIDIFTKFCLRLTGLCGSRSKKMAASARPILGARPPS